MVDPTFPPTPRSAFAGLSNRVVTTGCGVTVVDLDGLGLATVQVRRGCLGALAQRVRQIFELDLPQGPRRAGSGTLAFAGIGPGTWLAMGGREANRIALLLERHIGELAAVSDQSDGWAALRLTGPDIRKVLSKLVPLDLHPRAFAVGQVATTVASYIGLILWRLEDQAEGVPVFEIAVPRSYASSFWNHLAESSAEFGLVTTPT